MVDVVFTGALAVASVAVTGVAAEDLSIRDDTGQTIDDSDGDPITAEPTLYTGTDASLPRVGTGRRAALTGSAGLEFGVGFVLAFSRNTGLAMRRLAWTGRTATQQIAA